MEGLLLAIPGPFQWGLIMLIAGVITLYAFFVYTMLRSGASAMHKLFWSVIVLVFPLFGVIAYLMLRKVISIDVVNSGE